MNLSTVTRYLIAATITGWLSCPAASAQTFSSSVPTAVRLAVAKAIGTTQDSIISIEMIGNTHLSSTVVVEAIETAQDHSTAGIRVKLRCSPRKNCLPFYVLVRGATPPPLQPAPKDVVVPIPMLVRTGNRGWLQWMSTGNLKITVPVVALQPGRAGDVIRVRMGRRQIWQARIVSPGVFQAVGDQR